MNLAASNDPEHAAAIERLRTKLDEWLVQTGDLERPLEDPEPGLNEIHARIKRSNRGQLRYVLDILAQQRRSADISPEYLAYLDEIEPLIRRGMESKPE